MLDDDRIEDLLAMFDDDRVKEHMRRYMKPDGYCLHCERPANQHHPVGPITITISDPSDEMLTHEFCRWECLAKWMAGCAGGEFVIGPN